MVFISGLRFFYISGEVKIYSIPIPKRFVYKAIPELANQLVLEVNLFFETLNRKPWRLLNVSFDRIQLDENGQYTVTDEEVHKGMYNFNTFAYTTAEELSNRDIPLPIPKAIVIPDPKEKEVLVKYIKQKYPALWKNSADVIERSIRSRIASHSELVDMVKKASAIRRKKNV